MLLGSDVRATVEEVGPALRLVELADLAVTPQKRDMSEATPSTIAASMTWPFPLDTRSNRAHSTTNSRNMLPLP